MTDYQGKPLFRDPRTISTRTETPDNKLFFRCPECGYFRYITKDPDKQLSTVEHPIYKTITLISLAEVDARNHNCETHNIARGKAVKWRTHVRRLLTR